MSGEPAMDNEVAKESKFGTIPAVVGVVAVVLVALLGYYVTMKYRAGGASSEIVVLDSRKILHAATKQIIDNKTLTTEQVAQVSEKLAKNMQTLVGEYQAAGVIVINSSALLAYPKERDITPEFAEKLGVKLE